MLITVALAVLVQPQELLGLAQEIDFQWRIEGGVLVRRWADGERTLRSLPGREPGVAHAVALDDAGTAYVAADGGLFMAAPDCPVLDRIDFDFGAPQGRPVGVDVAGRDRLWLLTDAALFAVETRQFLWSELEVQLPTPPLTALRRREDGKHEVEGASGLVVLDLDGLESAPFPLARVCGVEARADGAYPLAHGSALELDLLQGARVRWMWREAARFRWLPLDPAAPRIEFPRPGRQTVCVVAFDHALRRAAEQRFEVDVAYPPSLAVSALAARVGAPVLALALLSIALAWRRERTLRAAWRTLLSVAIAAVLALQLAAALFPHSKGWPFVGFTMYTRVSQRDSISYRHEFLGLAPNGRWRELTPPGGAFGKYENERALQPFVHDDSGRSARFLAEWNRARPSERLVGIADVCRRRRLTPDGPVEIPRLIMFAHPAEVRRALP